MKLLELVNRKKEKLYSEARALINGRIVDYLTKNKGLVIYQKGKDKYTLYVWNSFNYMINMINTISEDIIKMNMEKKSIINLFARQYELNRVVLAISPLGIVINILNIKVTFDKIYKILEPYNDIFLRMYHFTNLLNMVNNSLPDEAEYIIDSLDSAVSDFFAKYNNVHAQPASQDTVRIATFINNNLIKNFGSNVVLLGKNVIPLNSIAQYDMIIINNNIFDIKRQIVYAISRLAPNKGQQQGALAHEISIDIIDTEYLFAGKYICVSLHNAPLINIYLDNRCGYQYIAATQKGAPKSPTYVLLLRFALLNIFQFGMHDNYIEFIKEVINKKAKFKFYNLYSMTNVICGFAELTKSRFDKKIISYSKNIDVPYSL